jgi:hypothetical protein
MNDSKWRWARSLWFLTLLVGFALPFATVACDAPGGYGRVGPGGTTTYSGFDLAAGGSPAITGEHELPAEQQRDDELAPQPLLLLGIAGLLAGGVATTMIANRRQRRLVSIYVSIATAAVIAAGQWVAQGRLSDRVTEQLLAGGAAVDPGASAGDYVSMAYGFWFVVVGLIALAAVDLVQRWRQGTDETDDDLRGAVSRHLESLSR